MQAEKPMPASGVTTMGKSAQKVGAIILVVGAAVVAFAAGRLSTTSWPIGGDIPDACVDYNKVRAVFVQAERECEARHSPYRWPVHAAVYRAYERLPVSTPLPMPARIGRWS